MPQFQSFYGEEGNPVDQSGWLRIVDRPSKGLGGLVVSTRPVLVSADQDVAWLHSSPFNTPLRITAGNVYGQIAGDWKVGYEHDSLGDVRWLSSIVIEHGTDSGLTTWASVDHSSTTKGPRVPRDPPFLVQRAGASFQVSKGGEALVKCHNVWRDSDDARRIKLFLEVSTDLEADGRCLVMAFAAFLRGFPNDP
ncbi:MAG: hypothetical protein JST30_03715 [Armatimonadetes bacterium]|nr:hypothetical protein [Armatimonadota bacterium]